MNAYFQGSKTLSLSAHKNSEKLSAFARINSLKT